MRIPTKAATYSNLIAATIPIDGGQFGIVSWAGFGHVMAPQPGSSSRARIGSHRLSISSRQS
jgi:hypothetical protein